MAGSKPEINYRELLQQQHLKLKKLQGRLDALERAKSEPIAIVGMACRFPGGAETPEAFWRLLEDGVDATCEVPADRWGPSVYDADPEAAGKMYTRRGAFLPRVDQFDAGFFGISPREAANIDPQHRLLLEVAWEALENAGQVIARHGRHPAGVFVGIMSNDYSQRLLSAGGLAGVDSYYGLGQGRCFSATRLSHTLGFQGPSVALDTACSSALVAVHLACQSLRRDECAMALAGGVNVILSPELGIFLSKIKALSPQGRSRSFDAAADGYARGEGCGLLVLKRLSDAQAQGDNILALIRGSAVNNDGPSSGLSVPSGPAQRAVIQSALKDAGVAPSEVRYVEASGLGSPLGDPIEIQAIADAMGEGRAPEAPLLVSSVKPNIGHLESAGGISQLMRVVLALQHEELQPLLHFKDPNPAIPWAELPVKVLTERTPWRAGDGRRLAGVHSFALSGTNAHVIVEEAPPRPAPIAPAAPESAPASHLLVLSARDPAALQGLAASYQRYLGSSLPGAGALPSADAVMSFQDAGAAGPARSLGGGASLEEICSTASTRRAHHEHRLAVEGGSRGALIAGLESFARGEPALGVCSGQAGSGSLPKLTFVFSGRSSALRGAGRRLLAQEAVFRASVEESDGLFRALGGPSLLEELSADEARAQPGETEISLPALFALQVALAALWASWGVVPDAVLGHGVGEVAAAHAAGALSLPDAARVAYYLGQALQRAGGAGQSVERELRGALAGIAPRAADVPLGSTATGRRGDGAGLGADAWARRAEPVDLAGALEALVDDTSDVFLEIGCDPALEQALRQTLERRARPASLLASLRPHEEERAVLHASLGALFCLGCPVAWSRLHAEGARCVALPTYPWQRERHWIAAEDSPTPRPSGRHDWTRTSPRHPLLGEPVAPPDRPDTRIWEVELSVAQIPYLGEYCVQGSAALSAASFVEMALSAGAEVFEQGLASVEDFSIQGGLLLPARGLQRLHLAARVETPDVATFKAWSHGDSAESARGAWTLCASGILRHGASAPADAEPARADLGAIEARCEEVQRGEEHYRSMAAAGLQHGPRLRVIERLVRRKGEVLARVGLPAGLTGDGYRIHPALLDALAQALGAAVSAWPDAAAGAYVPTALERLAIVGRPEAIRWCHVLLREELDGGTETVTADASLLDDEGRTVVEVRGLRAQRLEAAGGEAHASLGDTLRALAPEERRSRVNGYLLKRVAEVLGAAVDRLNLEQPLTSLGLDSLMAVELRNRVERDLTVTLSLAQLLQGGAVSALAAQLVASLEAPRAAPLLPWAPGAGGAGEGLALSYGQRAMWFLQQIDPASTAYNIVFAVRIGAGLVVSALEGAFQDLVDRHTSLRTTYASLDGEPRQRIAAEAKVHFELTDASRWREEEIPGRLADEAHQPFDLARGPMMRVKLFTRSDDTHLLLVTVHHVALDFWSFQVLFDELGTLYTARKNAARAALPPVALTYVDFVRWHASLLAGEEGERLFAYWKNQLRGELPPLDLATDRPRPAVQTYRGAAHDFRLTRELTRGIKDLARAQGTTVYTVLMAALHVLLHRLTGQEDILIGSLASGRSREEFTSIVGYFTNPVVLRADLSGRPSFGAVVRQVGQRVVEALDHQDYPFALLVERLLPARDPARSPIFQVMLLFQKPHLVEDAAAFVLGEPDARMALGDLTISSLTVPEHVSQLDVTLTMVESGGALAASLRYNTDLFDPATMERMGGHFQALLEGIVAAPEDTIDALPILPAAERQQLVVGWNQSAAEVPHERCVHELFEAQAERTPDAVAVIAGDQRLTYRQLNGRVNGLAHQLRELGVGPDAVVALLMDRSVELLIAILAVFKAGGAYLPLDPAHPAQRTSTVLEQSGAGWALATRPFVPALSSALESLPPARRPQLLALEELLQRGPREDDPPRSAGPTHLAYVIYTSGSTGVPKGAMVEHRGMLNHLFAKVHELGLTAADSLAETASQCFDISVWQFLATLVVGGRVHIVDDETAGDPRRLFELVDAGDITILEVVPSLLRMLLDGLGVPGAALPRLAHLRWLVLTGEALPPALCREWLALYPAIPLLNAYGPTECSDDVAHYRITAPLGDDVAYTPIGRPIINMQLYVLDASMQPVPVGVAGELYVGGIGVGRGYLNDPKRTSEVFLSDPFADRADARLYKSGDRVRYLPSGDIVFLGRLDHQVKIRGFRIELGEIEAVLEKHPSVRDVVVMAREDVPGDRRLVAYVVLGEASAPSTNELRGYLKEKLPEYMVPAAIVELGALPLTPNGKVDRRALPAPGRPDLDDAYFAPRTPIEEVLAGIFADVLRLEKVSIQDNFFDLGGHSLLATQVLARLRRSLGVELPLRAVFEAPSVAALAERADAERGRTAARSTLPLRRAPREGELPLSLAQQRLWFLDQLEPDSFVYNLAEAVRIHGPLDLAALRRSFEEIVRRHEVLRTTFPTQDGRPRQAISAAASMPMPVVDLRAEAEAEREQTLHRFLSDEARRPFDLTAGPLARVFLVRLSQEEHALLLTMHHIVADAWSFGVFIEELRALYPALRAGQPSPLPEPALQYVDYAVWQRQWLEGEVREAQLAYWKDRLSGAPPTLNLPTDRPRPPVQSYQGATARFELSTAVSAGLGQLCRSAGVTRFMALLAAFQVLLSRYTGGHDICVGSPVAGRSQLETEALLGFFVNMLVLRTDLSGDPTFLELLERVREGMFGAHDHHDVPFEQVVDALQPQRDLSYSPLFQVAFVLQNVPMRALALADVTLSPLPIENTVAKFDLTLTLEELDGGTRGAIEYNTDLFDASTIQRMVGHFQTLLEGIVADPSRPIWALPMLTGAERGQLLSWSEARLEIPVSACVHERFEAQVERTPDAVAVVFDAQQLTYQQLNRRANEVARHLIRLGIAPGALVGICVERSLEMIIGLLGILKAGAAYVPLDPAYPRERLAFMLEDCRAPVVLTQEHLREGLPAEGARVISLDVGWDEISQQSWPNPSSGATPRNVAYVIYTSGSTGKPKGVLVEHHNVVRLFDATDPWFHFDAGDVWTLFHSFAFDFSVWEIWGALLHGGKLVVVPFEVSRSPELFHALLCREGVTVLNQTPSAFRQLIAADAAAAGGELALRSVIFGGEALDLASLAPWFERHGDQRPELVNMYGITETTVHVTYRPLRASDLGGPLVSPIGRAIPDLRIYVLDDRAEPAPIGVIGELYVGGAGVARGYLKRPELSAQRFITDPFAKEPGARLYRTGDLARWLPDGSLDYLGRIDQQVKIRGFRIELGEIEASLSQHPSVREIVVLAREDAPGDKRLVAYVVPREALDLSASDLRSHLHGKLPEYMLPAAFVFLPAMPLTQNGKIDRRALPAPGAARPDRGEAFVAPRTPTEEALARIWSEVLGVEQVGSEDSFFALGGDSILAIQVISKAQQRGLGLSVRSVFQHQTLTSLATAVQSVPSSRADQELVTGPVLLTPILRWFVEQDRTDPHHYNQAVLLDLREALSPSLLEEALRHVARHHDALRLRLSSDGDGARLSNAGLDGTVPVRSVDLQATTPEQEAQAIEEAAAEVQASLSLSEGPLLAAALLDLGPSRPSKLLVVIHHLAIDGVSWRILLEDLQAVIKQIQSGEAVRLPLKTTSFQQWAERLSAHAQSDAVKQELPFWRSGLASAPLPVDLPGGANTVASARSVEVSLSAEETRALLQDVPRVYRTQINDVLLAALARSFARWTGAPRLRLDLEGHGREDIGGDLDLSRTVGWFTALFPVEIEASSISPREDLRAVKEQLRRVPNRGFGHGLLRYLGQDPTVVDLLAALPRSEVIFNYLGQFDQSLPEGALFGLARESAGPMHSPRSARTHLLEVTGLVAGGQLRLSFTYSENLHQRATIEELSRGYLEALRALLAHCLEPSAGGRTPGDFPLAGLSQAALDRLIGAGREVEDLYPLSPMQQGMLFHKLSDPTSGMYVEQLIFRLTGELDVAVFRAAWEQTLAQHPILRTSFAWEGLDAPLQRVHARVALPWAEHDLRGVPADEQQARLGALLAEDRVRGFDVAAAPLLRIVLVRLAEGVHECVFSHHHLLLDGWSVPPMLKELLALYEAGLRAEVYRLEPRPAYRDYIAWLQRQDMSKAEAFWREALRGVSSPTPLVVDRASAAAERGAAGPEELSHRLSAATTRALHDAARAQGLTLNTLVQGAFALLLSRYSGSQDVVFGATVSGRSIDLAGVDAMVGLFINTLPVRVQIEPEAPVSRWLSRLQERQAEQLTHEQSPLPLVRHWSGLSGDQELFSSLLVVENYPMDAELRKGSRTLSVSDVRAVEQTNFPLTLVVVPDASIQLRAIYAGDLFERSTIERMVRHFEVLLKGIVAHPEKRIGELSLLTEEERQTALVTWNATEGAYPSEVCLHELFEQQVARTPEATAVVFQDVRMTYGELERRSNQLGRLLRQRGAVPNTLVAVVLDKGWEQVVAVLGIGKSGGGIL